MSEGSVGAGHQREPAPASPWEIPPPGWAGADWHTLGAGSSDAVTSTSPPPPDRDQTPGRDGWVFTSVQDWVSGWLAPTISVELTTAAPYWCRQWWRHAEAVARLDACWRAWEFYREQTCAAPQPAPASMSLWWRDHATPHLDALLMSTRSPFRLCGRGLHTDGNPPLPIDPPPDTWSAEPTSHLPA